MDDRQFQLETELKKVVADLVSCKGEKDDVGERDVAVRIRFYVEVVYEAAQDAVEVVLFEVAASS